MSDDDRDSAFLDDFVAGLKAYVEQIDSRRLLLSGRALPVDRALHFLAAVGLRQPDGTTIMRVTCNVGKAGQDELISLLASQVAKARRRS